MENLLKQLADKHSEKFWNFLYVVDLPEEMLKEAFIFENAKRKLARIVLIREWQKVILRQHFS